MYKDKDTGGPKHGSYTLGVGGAFIEWKWKVVTVTNALRCYLESHTKFCD